MQINPYLNFNGNCAEAFKFYEKCLGGTIEMMMTHKDAPPEMQSPEWADKIMHARLNVNGAVLMGSDAPKQYYKTPQGTTVSISVEHESDAEHIFKELSEGGNVTMPLQQTFWAKRFGMVTDRFGIPWMVNCEND
jgi:PhnB protein